MDLRDILRAKGTNVLTIHPDASLEEVVDRLVEHNVGSLVVVEAGHATRAIGIITERDILRASARNHQNLAALRVRDAMSRRLIVGSLHDSVESIMGLMTEHRIRHLPVVEDGMLRGIISIGDVVKQQHDALCMENHYLRSYLHG